MRSFFPSGSYTERRREDFVERSDDFRSGAVGTGNSDRLPMAGHACPRGSRPRRSLPLGDAGFNGRAHPHGRSRRSLPLGTTSFNSRAHPPRRLPTLSPTRRCKLQQSCLPGTAAPDALSYSARQASTIVPTPMAAPDALSYSALKAPPITAPGLPGVEPCPRDCALKGRVNVLFGRVFVDPFCRNVIYT